MRDTSTGLVPVDDVLAADMIDATRISRLMAGYRDRPGVDRRAVIDAIVATARLAVDHPAIIGADINPLLADETGAVALDARIEIDPARIDWPAPNPTLSVRPYPAGWEKAARLATQEFQIRPIMPADAQLYPRFLARVTAETCGCASCADPTLSAEASCGSASSTTTAYRVCCTGPGRELAGIVRYNAVPTAKPRSSACWCAATCGDSIWHRPYANAHRLRPGERTEASGGVRAERKSQRIDIAERMGFRPAPGTAVNDVISTSGPDGSLVAGVWSRQQVCSDGPWITGEARARRQTALPQAPGHDPDDDDAERRASMTVAITALAAVFSTAKDSKRGIICGDGRAGQAKHRQGNSVNVDQT